MIIIREQDVPGVETPGGNLSRGLATPSRGVNEISVVRQRQQPGGNNPPHRHDRVEVMVQCAGSVTVEVTGEAVTLLPGDTLVIPAGATHQIRNNGDSEAEWLLIAAGGVRFFSATGEEMRPAWAQ